MTGPINGFRPNLFPAMPQMPIAPIGGAQNGNNEQVDFQQALLRSIQQVGNQELQANAALESSLVGNNETHVQAMISMKKTELAFRTLLQIRNKLIDAYNEIKDMRF